MVIQARKGLPRWILSLCFLFLMSASAAWGQSSDLHQEVFGALGGSFYGGNRGVNTALVGPPGGPFQPVPSVTRTEFSKSFRLVGGYRYWFKEKEGIEFTFSFSPNRMRFRETVTSTQMTAVVSFQTDARNIAANYVRKLPKLGRLEPFVTAGAGIGIFLGQFDGDAEAKFVVNFGLGADIPMTQRWLFRMEVRDFFSAQPTGGLGNFQRAPGGTTHNLVPTAGFALRF